MGETLGCVYVVLPVSSVLKLSLPLPLLFCFVVYDDLPCTVWSQTICSSVVAHAVCLQMVHGQVDPHAL